jgi:hypothetical protein
MTPLRKAMIEAMQVRGFSVRTHGSYLAAVTDLAWIPTLVFSVNTTGRFSRKPTASVSRQARESGDRFWRNRPPATKDCAPVCETAPRSRFP